MNLWKSAIINALRAAINLTTVQAGLNHPHRLITWTHSSSSDARYSPAYFYIQYALVSKSNNVPIID